MTKRVEKAETRDELGDVLSRAAKLCRRQGSSLWRADQPTLLCLHPLGGLYRPRSFYTHLIYLLGRNSTIGKSTAGCRNKRSSSVIQEKSMIIFFVAKVPSGQKFYLEKPYLYKLSGC